MKNQAHAKLLYRFELQPLLRFSSLLFTPPLGCLIAKYLQEQQKRRRIELYEKCKGNICSTFPHRSNNPGYARKYSSLCVRMSVCVPVCVCVCVFAPNWPEESCGNPLALFKRRRLVLRGPSKKYICLANWRLEIAKKKAKKQQQLRNSQI